MVPGEVTLFTYNQRVALAKLPPLRVAGVRSNLKRAWLPALPPTLITGLPLKLSAVPGLMYAFWATGTLAAQTAAGIKLQSRTAPITRRLLNIPSPLFLLCCCKAIFGCQFLSTSSEVHQQLLP